MTTSNPEGLTDPLAELRRLDLGDIRASDFTELAQRSLAGVLEAGAVPAASAVLHLSGDAVVANSVGVREAAHVLTNLQDVISAIGQALTGPITTRGAIPQAIRAQTALSLFPTPTPGSVQFHLAAPSEQTEPTLPGLEVEPMAGRAAKTFVEVLSEVGGDESRLVARLQELGPRVTRSLQAMAGQLIADGLDVDLTWRPFATAPVYGQLHRGEAAVLQEVIRRTRIDIRSITLVGYLVTVSRVQPASIILTGGERIPLEVDGELVPSLGPLFDRRVRAEAEETVMVSEATGQRRLRHQLVSIEAEPN